MTTRKRSSSGDSLPKLKRLDLSIEPDVNELHDDEFTVENLSPLTPLEKLEKVMPVIPCHSKSKWHRLADENWLLAGETLKNMKGPEWPEHALAPVLPRWPGDISMAMKAINKMILATCIADWQSNNDGHALFFVTGQGFYDHLFERELDEQLKVERRNHINKSGYNTGTQKLKVLLDDDKTGLTKDKLLESFKGLVNEAKEAGVIKVALEGARKICSQLKGAKRTGIALRKSAIWIGICRKSEEQVKEWMEKAMVESPAQAEQGIQYKAFKEDEYICVDELMNRVCAPLPGTPATAQSIIFWTKDSETDENKTWDKVFGGIVYNLDKKDSKFSEENKHIQEEMAAIKSSLLAGSSNPIPRKVNDGGLMVKGPGPQAVFTKPYQAKIPVPDVKSANPLAKTLEKVKMAKQLRLKMKVTTPLIQARTHQLLAGFLPHFAQQQWDLSRTSKHLRNQIGYPSLSSFGTYAYCASGHVDQDESATSGFVMKRSEIVQRNEANFVWVSHGLVVELANQAYWFWDAPNDAHGTTMNRLALKRPKSYKSYLSEESACDSAQWTRVLVMPRAVVHAHRSLDEQD